MALSSRAFIVSFKPCLGPLGLPSLCVSHNMTAVSRTTSSAARKGALAHASRIALPGWAGDFNLVAEPMVRRHGLLATGYWLVGFLTKVVLVFGTISLLLLLMFDLAFDGEQAMTLKPLNGTDVVTDVNLTEEHTVMVTKLTDALRTEDLVLLNQTDSLELQVASVEVTGQVVTTAHFDELQRGIQDMGDNVPEEHYENKSTYVGDTHILDTDKELQVIYGKDGHAEQGLVLPGDHPPKPSSRSSRDDEVGDYWEVEFTPHGLLVNRIHVNERVFDFRPDDVPLPPGVSLEMMHRWRLTEMVPTSLEVMNTGGRREVVGNWDAPRQFYTYDWTGRSCFRTRQGNSAAVPKAAGRVPAQAGGSANAKAKASAASSTSSNHGEAVERALETRSRSRSRPRLSTRRLEQEHHESLQRRLIMTWPIYYVSPVLCALGYMFRPGQGGPQPQGGPRQHAHVGDAGPPFVGTATLKCPPAWSVERNHIYSFRSWVSDIILWSSATEVDARRQGPIAALQVQGSAKELIRELTPAQLRDGDIDQATGAPITGLMLLVQVLARRYAPLDAESSTKSIAEFLGFRRLPGEGIDGVLVRFEVLRLRAQNAGGFVMGPQGLAWLLLQALQIGPEGWDRLLAPLQGALPQHEADLGQLIERIRRSGHVREGGFHHHHPGATGDPGHRGNYYFPTFGPAGQADPWQAPGGDPWGVFVGSGAGPGAASGPTMASPQAPGVLHSGVPAHGCGHFAVSPTGNCPTCGLNQEQAYAMMQDDNSSATTSDDGGTPADDGAGGDGRTPEELYQDYAFARRKWRKYSGKAPRRFRSFKPGNWRGGGKGSYAAFLPPGAFAGGKGGPGGAGKFRKKNPKSKDGSTMKCHQCGSEEHLIRRCPQRGQGDGRGVSGTMHAREVQPGSTQLALTGGNPMSWSIGTATLPGVSFHAQARSTGSVISLELDKLRSVSQPASEVSFPTGETRLTTTTRPGR